MCLIVVFVSAPRKEGFYKTPLFHTLVSVIATAFCVFSLSMNATTRGWRVWTRGFSGPSWRIANSSTVARLFSSLDRKVDNEDELVRLCEGEYGGLKTAFSLGGGVSMRVKHLRSYTEASLKELVREKSGPWELLPPWLDANNLRPLLRDYESPAVTKKAKAAESIPPVVFRADQGKS